MADWTIRPQGAARSSEVDLDDGASGGIYNLDQVETDWGKAEQAEPQEEGHSQGTTLYLPLEEVWKRRAIRLVGWVDCVSSADKQLRESKLRQLLQGSKTLRRKGWEIDVFGTGFLERDGSKRSPLLLEYEVMLLATPPFWRMAEPLNAIDYSDGLLYADLGVPVGEAQASYIFGSGGTAMTLSPGAGVPHFTMSNWGTAYAYASASLTGFPASTTLYLEGAGRYRIKKTTSGAGAATLTEADRFYLAPGDNAIRFEDANGNAITVTGSAKIDFGATVFRYL